MLTSYSLATQCRTDEFLEVPMQVVYWANHYTHFMLSTQSGALIIGVGTRGGGVISPPIFQPLPYKMLEASYWKSRSSESTVSLMAYRRHSNQLCVLSNLHLNSKSQTDNVP